jgi:hypothetical protein
MENLCHFVCSRGILKYCTFKSINPKSSCNNDNQYLYDMITSNKMFDGMSIYLCSDLLKFFVIKILPLIKNNFILVSGDSDINVPLEILSNKEFLYLINSKYLIKWLVQNTQFQHYNKIIQIPIGLDYHTILNNPKHIWKVDSEGNLPIEQEKILLNIIDNSVPFYKRIPKIYVNFSLANDRFGQRKKSIKEIPNNLIVYNKNTTKRTLNWNLMKNYTFILSPFGNGMDCHRTWEALCLGCIPILNAPNFKELFKNLPVLFVDNWKDINQELLDKTIEQFKNTNFNYSKLTLDYWKNIITN